MGWESQPLRRSTTLPQFPHSFIHTQNLPLLTVHCSILFSISTKTGSAYRRSSHCVGKGDTEPQGDTVLHKNPTWLQHRGIRSESSNTVSGCVSVNGSSPYVRPPLSSKASRMHWPLHRSPKTWSRSLSDGVGRVTSQVPLFPATSYPFLMNTYHVHLNDDGLYGQYDSKGKPLNYSGLPRSLVSHFNVWDGSDR